MLTIALRLTFNYLLIEGLHRACYLRLNDY